MPVIDLLFADKEVPYFGVHISTVTQHIAQKYDIPKGVYIKKVEIDSPAMDAGLQSGDVIRCRPGGCKCRAIPGGAVAADTERNLFGYGYAGRY